MQCAALKSEFAVTTAGLSPISDSKIEFIKLNGHIKKAPFSFHQKYHSLIRFPFSLINKFYMNMFGSNASYSLEDFEILNKKEFDLIICHHPDSLEIAEKLKRKNKCKIIFNAHEIYPYEFEFDKEWMNRNFKRLDHILTKYLPNFDAVFSVNKEISDFYSSRYKCKTVTVHNSKAYKNLQPSQSKTPIRIIHHGGAMPQRKLELMADAVLACNGKYELTFMLMSTNNDYLKTLKHKYEPLGIIFVEPVEYSQIIEAINQYDVGLYILPNDTINHELALPNKVFEFIQAKLALVTSPNAAIKNLILKYHLGIVSKEFTAESMAETLNNLTVNDIERFKSKAKEFSKELSSEKDEERILNTVKNLILN